MTIRDAVPSEKGELEALQLRASLTNAGDRAALLAHPDAIEIPLEELTAGDVFVLEFHDRIAGFAAVQPRADHEMDLDALFVEPELMRHGVGRLLVEHCAQIARSRGFRALYVIGNPHAEAFYRSCAFEPLGSAETRFGTGMVMRKSLAVLHPLLAGRSTETSG
jgi:GNAT superfamily N-acetyltransferase